MKNYVRRKLEDPLKEALRQFPVVLITGPRQAGKSTLLKQMLKGYQYVSFDDVLVKNFAEKEPALFLSTYKTPVILDEIQYVPSLLSHIKLVVDKDRRNYGQYVLTGSQVFSLMKGVSESLAGRIMIFDLLPLSWDEISPNYDLDNLELASQMLRGFYPEFQVNPELKAKFWHSSYLSTYIERDLRSIRNIHDLGIFQRFLVLLAARAGQLLNLQEVGKECGISQTTAKDWLTLLQSTFIIHLLEPYTRNISKRVVKSPKLFFTDTGLLCYLLRIESAKQLIESPFSGHVFENMVVMEKIKSFLNKGERAPCYFYRTATGQEIDLIVDNGNEFEAYEIKFSASPNKEMTKALSIFAKEHKTTRAYLLNLRREALPFSNGVEARYWYDIHKK